MNGIALTVLISQLPKLFGFSIDGVGPVRDLMLIAKGILGGQVNWRSFAVGASTHSRQFFCLSPTSASWVFCSRSSLRLSSSVS